MLFSFHAIRPPCRDGSSKLGYDVQGLIGLGLSIGKATEKGHADYGTAWGVAGMSSPAQATWDIFVALGSMAFACKPLVDDIWNCSSAVQGQLILAACVLPYTQLTLYTRITFGVALLVCNTLNLDCQIPLPYIQLTLYTRVTFGA